VLGAYDDVFGFDEYSKVPGKKLRVRVHLVDAITKPPHFAPQYAYHSEVDFPVIDTERLDSPTDKGQFLFYGLCHELGHVIAMWGDRSSQADHHAWAHYTGVTIVEHLAESRKQPKWLSHCRDKQWRSLSKERKRLADTAPSTQDNDGVLKLLIELHDSVGPEAIGSAINTLDEQNKRLRINHVRYYEFPALEEALLSELKGKQAKRKLKALFADAPK